MCILAYPNLLGKGLVGVVVHLMPIDLRSIGSTLNNIILVNWIAIVFS
jgi:hypothetical protein